MEKHLFTHCCVRCNNRNILRAANTGNLDLMKSALLADDKISQITAYWSAENKETALEYATDRNDIEMLKLILTPPLPVPEDSNYEKERVKLLEHRV